MKNIAVIKELENADNWKPHLTRIAKKTRKATSSVSGYYHRRRKKGLIQHTIRVLSEEEKLREKGETK